MTTKPQLNAWQVEGLYAVQKANETDCMLYSAYATSEGHT
jgi:hypothetical protein